MAGGPWTIEGIPHRYGCLRSVRVMAAKLAMKTQADVVVRCHAPKNAENSDPMKSDFKVNPLGHYDYSIDPTWKGR